MMDCDKLVLTTPHMDLLSHIYQFLFTQLGFSFVVPPKLTKKTVKMGRKLGKEGFCQPLNDTLGDLYFAIKNGANAVIMTAGDDSCRYGFYWATQKMIIEDYFGFKVPFFIISHITPKKSIKEIMNTYNKTMPEEKFDAIWEHTSHKILWLTELTKKSGLVRAFEEEPGISTKAYKRIALTLLAEEDFSESERIFRDGMKQLDSLKAKSVKDPIRILLVGAIYEVLEPNANHHIEEYLATLGIIVERSLTYTDLAPIISREREADFDDYETMLYNFGKQYIDEKLANFGFGGYGMMTISHAARAKAYKFDGIIHVHSFSCMPEIIAKIFLKKISRVENIPIMTLVVEEITSEALYHNRIEAFIDLIRERKLNS